jgi:hypothetical protein
MFLSATLIFFFLADKDTGAEFFPHSPTNALATEGGAGHFHSGMNTVAFSIFAPLIDSLLVGMRVQYVPL